MSQQTPELTVGHYHVVQVTSDHDTWDPPGHEYISGVLFSSKSWNEACEIARVLYESRDDHIEVVHCVQDGILSWERWRHSPDEMYQFVGENMARLARDAGIQADDQDPMMALYEVLLTASDVCYGEENRWPDDHVEKVAYVLNEIIRMLDNDIHST